MTRKQTPHLDHVLRARNILWNQTYALVKHFSLSGKDGSRSSRTPAANKTWQGFIASQRIGRSKFAARKRQEGWSVRKVSRHMCCGDYAVAASLLQVPTVFAWYCYYTIGHTQYYICQRHHSCHQSRQILGHLQVSLLVWYFGSITITISITFSDLQYYISTVLVLK